MFTENTETLASEQVRQLSGRRRTLLKRPPGAEGWPGGQWGQREPWKACEQGSFGTISWACAVTTMSPHPGAAEEGRQAFWDILPGAEIETSVAARDKDTNRSATVGT